ncbi:MAG: hypothetical protein IMX00_09985 [Limnochordales bacterium]|nr:hypothetical protein [Limnochordales bacterium]
MFVWDYLQKLVSLPHRGSATPAEARAAEVIAAELQQLGFEVERQFFLAPRKTLYFGPPVVIALFLISHLVLGATQPWLSALLMVVVALPLLGELRGGRFTLDVFLPRFLSQNVIARPAGCDGAPAVVVTAHFDTQWGSWFFSPVFRPFIRAFFTIS